MKIVISCSPDQDDLTDNSGHVKNKIISAVLHFSDDSFSA